MYQYSYGRASAYVGGQNLLTSDVIYHSFLRSPAYCLSLHNNGDGVIKRYLKQRRQTGEVCVKAIPGRPPKKFAPLQAGLVAQLEAHADATLETHCLPSGIETILSSSLSERTEQ